MEYKDNAHKLSPAVLRALYRHVWSHNLAFKEDPLAYHRYKRSPKDPDAFTMGQRTLGDFLLFYAYVLVGGILTILQFVLLSPAQTIRLAVFWRACLHGPESPERNAQMWAGRAVQVPP